MKKKIDKKDKKKQDEGEGDKKKDKKNKLAVKDIDILNKRNRRITNFSMTILMYEDSNE